MSDELSAEDVPIPPYNHHRVTSTREKLVAALAQHNERLEGDRFTSFVGAVKMCLPYIVTTQTVHDSLLAYLGKELTAADRSNIACRLSGNLDELCIQKPVLSWSRPVSPEWSLSVIQSVHVVRRSDGQLKNRVVFTVLTGSYAGKSITVHWTFRRFNYSAVAVNENGFGFGLTRARFNKDGDDRSRYTYANYKQLIGFECYLLFDPKRCVDAPAFSAVGHNAGTQAHNRKLLLSRLRANSPCILSEKVQYSCYACPVGTDTCPRAVRVRTCYVGVCKQCKKKEVVDPSDPAFRDICIRCAELERRRKK